MKEFLLLVLICFSQNVFGQIKILDSALYTIIQKDSTAKIDLAPGEIQNADKILIQALKGYKLFSKTDFNDYRFQLVPSINEKGEKIVWINAFCFGEWGSQRRSEWRKKIYPRHMVDDGGTCFFDLKINLTLNNYSEFGMNGFA